MLPTKKMIAFDDNDDCEFMAKVWVLLNKFASLG